MRAAAVWGKKDITKIEQRLYRMIHSIPNDVSNNEMMNVVSRHSAAQTIERKARSLRPPSKALSPTCPRIKRRGQPPEGENCTSQKGSRTSYWLSAGGDRASTSNTECTATSTTARWSNHKCSPAASQSKLDSLHAMVKGQRIADWPENTLLDIIRTATLVA